VYRADWTRFQALAPCPQGIKASQLSKGGNGVALGRTALVDSLRYDPFYVAITEEFADNEARRRRALARYFDY
jgi:hypothetical protein